MARRLLQAEGYEEIEAGTGSRVGADRVLAKPFRARQFVDAVQGEESSAGDGLQSPK